MDAHNFFAADDDDLIIINRQGLTDRPTVTLLQDDFVNVAEEVEALLRATCSFLFRRGNRLVVPAYREAKASDDTIVKTCSFVRWRPRYSKNTCHCPLYSGSGKVP